MIIQRATLDNVHALVELEQSCFSVPWSRKSFEVELDGNQFSRILMISHPEPKQYQQAIAYVCAWIIFEEVRFLNLAVHQNFRRQGLARQLIEGILRLGIEAGCCRGMLEVRAGNTAAKNLYEYFNFKAYATRTAYYTNPHEDAILMSLEPLEVKEKEGAKFEL